MLYVGEGLLAAGFWDDELGFVGYALPRWDGDSERIVDMYTGIAENIGTCKDQVIDVHGCSILVVLLNRASQCWK